MDHKPAQPCTPDETGAITQLLTRWRAGDSAAESALVEAVYPLLQALARRSLRGAAITLSPTELVHESYLRLFAAHDADYNHRRHFYAVAALTIRNVLVDICRERQAQKRGGGLERVTLAAIDDLPTAPEGIGLLDVDRLLTQLARIDSRAAKLVELRFFAGLSIHEAADTAGYSASTAKRCWQFARAWLHEQLADTA
ncbi:RNA polymerase sigma factor (TIGR02999 family) [Tahibacter aquaticus]|uniref:RNA polymerase sigma factor (TIGR02999 family) n=1 Tax=Tahibacter aquaticus TaxID=520092 RepID=A0A4R6YPF1_9GAMM|nr:ECF-type sigma factor [Tahibacter aquaticus]TDR39467.1 RNA polymerase sigma factor (TIGR02999 family) [Tahibacter aquaticus]